MYEEAWLVNQANLIGKHILETFPHDGNTRKQAKRYLVQNYRASEFYENLTPMHRPNMELNTEFEVKYPEFAQKYESKETKTLYEDFRKLEDLVDFLRKEYKSNQKIEKRTMKYFLHHKEKREKYSVQLQAIHTFGGLAFSFRNQENQGNLSDTFWENALKSNDDWDLKVEEE